MLFADEIALREDRQILHSIFQMAEPRTLKFRAPKNYDKKRENTNQVFESSFECKSNPDISKVKPMKVIECWFFFDKTRSKENFVSSDWNFSKTTKFPP